MIKRDPNKELLEAYYSLMNGHVVYDEKEIKCGTRISRDEKNYIYFYLENIEDYMITDDTIIYEATMGIEIVSVQDLNGGDDTAVNSILDQVMSIVSDAENLIMTNFGCSMTTKGNMDYNTQTSETNTLIIKKLRINHLIEQI